MSTRFSRAHLLTQVLGTQQHEVILHLYDGALNHLDRAFEAIRIRDFRKASEAVQRASAIIIELSCGLDYHREGSLALRMDSIYNYLIEALALAARSLDTDALETCRSVLLILKEAWSQAVESDRRGRLPVLESALGLGA